MHDGSIYVFHLNYVAFVQRISVTVNSGLKMCRGGSSDPTVVVQIWSIGVFGKDKNSAYSGNLFEFFKKYLPSVPEDR